VEFIRSVFLRPQQFRVTDWRGNDEGKTIERWVEARKGLFAGLAAGVAMVTSKTNKPLAADSRRLASRKDEGTAEPKSEDEGIVGEDRQRKEEVDSDREV
jgi:hypothetical protein